MKVYMLEDTNTGLFFRRNYSWDCWVEQGKASVWTNRIGPTASRAYTRQMKARKPVIRTFNLEPTDE